MKPWRLICAFDSLFARAATLLPDLRDPVLYCRLNGAPFCNVAMHAYQSAFEPELLLHETLLVRDIASGKGIMQQQNGK